MSEIATTTTTTRVLPPDDFGQLLREERQRRGLRLIDVAEASVNPADPSEGISVSYLSALERNWKVFSSGISQKMLDAIARGLGIRDPWIVYEWAGWERPTEAQARTLAAIEEDPWLSESAKNALRDLYRVLVMAPRQNEDGASV